MSKVLQILQSFVLVALLWGATDFAVAQDTPLDGAPSFTAQMLDTRVEALKNNTQLSEEQLKQAQEFYQTANTRLADATRQTERRTQYLNDIRNVAAQRSDIATQIEVAQQKLAETLEPMGEMIGEDALFGLEQDLIGLESELAEVETRLQGITDGLQTLTARQNLAPKELVEARTQLGDLQSNLLQLGEGELEAVSDARRIALQARVWFQRNRIRTLEQEIASLPLRQEILISRRTLAGLQAQSLRRQVQRLADLTGQKRVNEAQALRNDIAAQAASVTQSHPLLASFAQSNLTLADEISEFANQGSQISQRTAAIRGRAVNVENDLSAATDLVSLGRLDREAGATLRRLGNQLLPPANIEANMRATQDLLATATRQRVIAQESLRDLPVGGFNIDAALAAAKRDAPDLPDMSADDRTSLQEVIDTRRNLLRQIATQATARINDISELQAAQTELLELTTNLQNLLDENLLWVRSVPAIDFGFPQKVVLGALELVSVRNLEIAATEFIAQTQRYILIVFIFLALTFLIFRLRSKVRADANRRAAMVGRVKEDSAWHTPAVITGGIFNSLPFPLIFLLIGLLYALSDNPNRIIEGLGDGFIYLSMFTLFFLTWIRWDREKGLFDIHFKLADHVRRVIASNLRWFVPFVGTTSTILAITDALTDQNIIEGLSVFMFILTGLALVVFAIRILWANREKPTSVSPPETTMSKFRGAISFLIIGLPLVAIGLALTGYYESADELLGRIFLTVAIVLLTYVIFGAIRRAIVVAQRQIKYRQAIERRESELKARRDKEAAEERGEDMPAPPPIDTKEIDVTTITRQTSQLLRTAVLLGFAGLMWVTWSSLVPALSIFDGFEVWRYGTGTLDDDGNAITQAVSVWDLFQALVILVLTFIAARNLPGFLEVFVLNRLGVDPGTRYAVVTVLGYIIVAVGIIVGFNQLGLQWSQLRWIVTGLSVGIGFGLQKIIANFVSGLIILFERPIRIGDYVTIGDQSGTVSRIKIRATTLKDLDNLEILIPNEALISERVTNWTLSSSITRLIVPVGIAYGSDTDKARDLMLEKLKTIPKVLDTPAPQVLFMGFGDSSLDFQCRVYLRSFEERVPMTHTIHTEINKTLEEAGIPIPFPQRDLNIVSQNIPLEVLSKAPLKPMRKSKPSADPKN